MSMKDSIASSTKLKARQSQFIEMLNQPMSADSIKLFSSVALDVIGTKSKTLKIRKLQSLESNSTDEDYLGCEQERFVLNYKNDVFFRKKVDIILKQHEKRMKLIQDNYSSSKTINQQSNFTWRAQRHLEDMKLLQMYQKCKKWIDRAKQAK